MQPSCVPGLTPTLCYGWDYRDISQSPWKRELRDCFGGKKKVLKYMHIQNLKNNGTSVVAWHMKLLAAVPASHMGMSLNPSCSTSHHAL